MRVLHILDHSLPLQSGYVFRTLGILGGQRALGWETFHLTSPKHFVGEAPKETFDGYEFFRTPIPTSVSLPIVREFAQMRATTNRLEEVAREVKPDLLHAHSPALNGVPALRVGKRLGIPVLYEVRAFWEDAAVDHGTTGEGSLRYRATRALETYVLKRADAITTLCEGTRKDIVARGIGADKVTVIPNAVDVEKFTMPTIVNDNKDDTVIGFIGSFYAYEGLDLLIEAMPQLIKGNPNLKLLLVGGGPQDQALRARCQELNLADYVTFTGRVPHEEVQGYYDQMDIMIYPRHKIRLTDLVTPLKPLEAMASGKIVVASDVGGHLELIEDGRTGFLFSADNTGSLSATVLTAIAARTDWATMRNEGRRFVEEDRNWLNCTKPYESVAASISQG